MLLAEPGSDRPGGRGGRPVVPPHAAAGPRRARPAGAAGRAAPPPRRRSPRDVTYTLGDSPLTIASGVGWPDSASSIVKGTVPALAGAQGRPMLRPARSGRGRAACAAAISRTLRAAPSRRPARPGPTAPRRAASSARPSPPPRRRARRVWKMCSRLSSQPSTWVVAWRWSPGRRLAQVREVRLDGEVAADALEVGGVDADQAQQRVGRVAEHLQVAALVRVAVVVHPLRRHRGRVQLQRLREVGRGGGRRRPASSSARS